MGTIKDGIKIERRRIDDLVIDEDNPRKHKSVQIALIVESLREYGYLNPIIITRDGRVLAGHGRIEAMKALAVDEVDCLVIDKELSENEKDFIAVADNVAYIGAFIDYDELMRQFEEKLKEKPEIFGMLDDEVAVIQGAHLSKEEEQSILNEIKFRLQDVKKPRRVLIRIHYKNKEELEGIKNILEESGFLDFIKKIG